MQFLIDGRPVPPQAPHPAATPATDSDADYFSVTPNCDEKT
jgi:hypothetical protein